MSTPPDEQHEQSPWSRPGVLISGAFLLALILAGILVAVSGGGGHHTTHSTAQQPAASTTTPTSNPTSSTACTLPPGSQAIPSSSPPVGTQWATVGSMQVPQAPNLYGPQRTHGVFNTCFAHSPSGALLAALNLWAESTAADPSQVFQKLAVGAPKNLGNNSRLDASGPVQFAGYKIRLLHAHASHDRGRNQRCARANSLLLVTPMRVDRNRLEIRLPAERHSVAAGHLRPHRLRAME